jgi:GNAT superfamily N-acetyltransferase
MKSTTLSDQSHLKIEFATQQDLPSIISFVKMLAEFEKLEDQVKINPKEFGESLFGEKKYAEVLMARRNNQVIGFALFFHNFSTFLGKPGLYLEDLFVLPEVRSLGVGKILLKTLAEVALSRGCARFEWSVLDWNKRAISFYESLGAKPLDEWTVYRLTGKDLNQLAN